MTLTTHHHLAPQNEWVYPLLHLYAFKASTALPFYTVNLLESQDLLRKPRLFQSCSAEEEEEEEIY